jgi:hypothetical protein
MALVLRATFCFLVAAIISHVISSPSWIWTMLVLGLIVLVIELLLSLSQIYNLAVEFIVARTAASSIKDHVAAVNSSDVLGSGLNHAHIDSEEKAASSVQHQVNSTDLFKNGSMLECASIDSESKNAPSAEDQVAVGEMLKSAPINSEASSLEDQLTALNAPDLVTARETQKHTDADEKTFEGACGTQFAHPDNCSGTSEMNMDDRSAITNLEPEVAPVAMDERIDDKKTKEPIASMGSNHDHAKIDVCSPDARASTALSEAEQTAQLAEKELIELLEAEELSKSSCSIKQKQAVAKSSTEAKRSKAKKEKPLAKVNTQSHDVPATPTKTRDEVQSTATKQCKTSQNAERKSGRLKNTRVADNRSAMPVSMDKRASQPSKKAIDVLSAVAESNNLNGKKKSNVVEECLTSSRSQSEDNAGDCECKELVSDAGAAATASASRKSASVTLVPNAKTLVNLEVNEKTKKKLKTSVGQDTTVSCSQPSKQTICVSELRDGLAETTVHQEDEASTRATGGCSDMIYFYSADTEPDQRQGEELQYDPALVGTSSKGSMLAAELRAKFPEAKVLSCGATVTGSNPDCDTPDNTYVESQSLSQSSRPLNGTSTDASVLEAELRARFPAASIHGARVHEEWSARESSRNEFPQPVNDDHSSRFETGHAPENRSTGSMLAAELAAQFPGATIHVGLPPSSMVAEVPCNAEDGPSDHRSSSSRTSSTAEPSMTLSMSSALECLSSSSSCPQQPFDNEPSMYMPDLHGGQPCSSHFWIDSSVSDGTVSHGASTNLSFTASGNQGFAASSEPCPVSDGGQSKGAQWRAELKRKGEQQLSQVQQDLRRHQSDQSMPGMANLEALSKGSQRRAELQLRGKQQLREVEEELLHRYGAEGWLWGQGHSLQGSSLQDHQGNAHGDETQNRSLLDGLQSVKGSEFSDQHPVNFGSQHCEKVTGALKAHGNPCPPDHFRNDISGPSITQQSCLSDESRSLLRGLTSVNGTSLSNSKDRLGSSHDEALKPRLVELAKELCIEPQGSVRCSSPKKSSTVEQSTSAEGLAALMGPCLAEAWASHGGDAYDDFSGAHAWDLHDCTAMQNSSSKMPVPPDYWQNVGVCVFQPTPVNLHVPESNAPGFDVVSDVVQIVGYQAACQETQTITGLLASAAELQAAAPDHYED